jgi:hypothetical protein
MEFLDIRRGTDVEFGLSTYEPFGIAQLEPLASGALCVLSSSCGSVGFLRQARGETAQHNVLIADYLGAASARAGSDWQQALRIGQSAREEAEAQVSARVASAVLDALPQSDLERRHMLQAGYELSQRMSWEVVVEKYFLPGLLHLAG